MIVLIEKKLWQESKAYGFTLLWPPFSSLRAKKLRKVRQFFTIFLTEPFKFKKTEISLNWMKDIRWFLLLFHRIFYKAPCSPKRCCVLHWILHRRKIRKSLNQNAGTISKQQKSRAMSFGWMWAFERQVPTQNSSVESERLNRYVNSASTKSVLTTWMCEARWTRCSGLLGGGS